jgi:hypothetical protein
MRNANLCPTRGSKSFFISQSSISAGVVSARQTFSGGCGISRSITMVRVSVAPPLAAPGVASVIGPSV